MVVKLQRVYDDPDGTEADGYRLFVDRLWPRGESKARFHYDLWAKDVAPSAALRQWFHADSANRWAEFASRYMAELEASSEAHSLRESLKGFPVVTLLYASHDALHNNAVVFAGFLQKG